MANYKTANQLPVLEEVTETTYALVEDGGALKRVSGELLGGKSNCCVISVDKTNAIPKPMSAEGSDEDGTIYTCNMDYDELMTALQEKTLGGFNIIIYAGTEMRLGYVSSLYFSPEAPGIMIEWRSNSDYGMIQFNSDNTISEYAPEPS
jgi:hypothetical protein